MDEEFELEESFLDETSRLYKELLRKTYVVLGFYFLTYVATFFDKYQDFDVVFTSWIFKAIFILSMIPTVINLGLYFFRLEFHKKSYFEFIRREKDFYELVSVIPIFIAVLTIMNAFFISTANVEGSSMEPSYTDGNTIFITHTTNVDRFDVVIVKVERFGEDEYFIKRVIGLPGDIVRIESGQVYVNDVLLDDSEYIMENSVTTCKTGPNGDIQEVCSWEVGENQFFVLGDNRMYSNDSRTGYVDLVEEVDIYGKVVLKLGLFK